MPRSRSWAIQSVVVSPSCTAPILCFRPVRYKMPSVVVVLPASIWAIMPMFRILSIGVFLAAIYSLMLLGTGEVGEGPVGVGHFMHVLALFNCGALAVVGVL